MNTKCAPELRRMWINQPSGLQALHHLHGTNVLALREDENTYRIYFLSGDAISQQASPLALSKGWKTRKPIGKRLAMKCAQCGSTEVRRDAWAEWDADAQQWVLGTVFDYAHCEQCEGETTITEVSEVTP